jgi:hypothetical protein
MPRQLNKTKYVVHAWMLLDEANRCGWRSRKLAHARLGKRYCYPRTREERCGRSHELKWMSHSSYNSVVVYKMMEPQIVGVVLCSVLFNVPSRGGVGGRLFEDCLAHRRSRKLESCQLGSSSRGRPPFSMKDVAGRGYRMRLEGSRVSAYGRTAPRSPAYRCDVRCDHRNASLGSLRAHRWDSGATSNCSRERGSASHMRKLLLALRGSCRLRRSRYRIYGVPDLGHSIAIIATAVKSILKELHQFCKGSSLLDIIHRHCSSWASRRRSYGTYAKQPKLSPWWCGKSFFS